MSAEDNDNLYVINEEIEKDPDSSPLNYAAYDGNEDDISQSEDNEKKEVVSYSPFKIMLSIMFNPVEGWKSLRRKEFSIEQLQGGCFYPLLAILAVSKFADYFYTVNETLTSLVTQAVVTFVAFFFGYFCIQKILMWILPKDMAEKFNCDYGKKYIMISLATFALFSIFINILPMIWPILIFLPIWTLYIMFKGVRFFYFEIHQEMKFFVLSGFAVIGMPILIDWALNAILPY